jgi:segregation and condensation protein A
MADHQVLFERVSIADRVVELTELLSVRRRLRFEALFERDGASEPPSRLDLVLTFLALLEMCKMRVARIRQDEPLAELIVELAPKHLGDAPPPSETPS